MKSLTVVKTAQKYMSKLVGNSSIYRCRLNAVTGTTEWAVEDDDYDFYQEIARSGYADMLHDTERNQYFRYALEAVIKELRSSGQSVHVLDIGTGTGLLAMLAARAGADKVTACEAFQPMAETAKRIISANGLSDRIRLIEKRSTDMTEEDIQQRANVLVAEVFDTELIGEGALRTFVEAHQNLLTKNCRVIPSRATVYAQVISSDVVKHWSSARRLQVDVNGRKITVEAPQNCTQCVGNVAVHDLQLDQLPQSSFVPLTKPIPVFRFDFEKPQSIKYDENVALETLCMDSGQADAVLMWWDLDMDGTGEYMLSTEPKWDGSPTQWRDHWMQAIFYLPHPLKLKKNAKFYLQASHDEHSLWFDVSESRPKSVHLAAPQCDCSLHIVCTRSTLAFLNDESRYQHIASVLDKVYVSQSNNRYDDILIQYANANKIRLNEKMIFVDDSLDIQTKDPIDCVIGDPFFFHALLPWHNIHFWYKVDKLRLRGNLLSKQCQIFPRQAHIKAMGVALKDLWKIRAPVNSIEGCDLRIFDGIVEYSAQRTDASVEPQPLWEYPGIALSSPIKVATYDFRQDVPLKDTVCSVTSKLTDHGMLNGVAFWVDWEFADNVQFSTGLRSDCAVGQAPNWYWHCRQGIHLLRNSVDLAKNKDTNLVIESKLDSTTGDIDFDINVS